MARRSQSTVGSAQQAELFESVEEIITPVRSAVATTPLLVHRTSQHLHLRDGGERYLDRANTYLIAAVSTCVLLPLVALIPVLMKTTPEAAAAYAAVVLPVWLLGGRWLHGAYVRHFEASREARREQLWRETVDAAMHLISSGDPDSAAMAGTLLCHPRTSDRMTQEETTEYLRSLQTRVAGPAAMLRTWPAQRRHQNSRAEP